MAKDTLFGKASLNGGDSLYIDCLIRWNKMIPGMGAMKVQIANPFCGSPEAQIEDVTVGGKAGAKGTPAALLPKQTTKYGWNLVLPIDGAVMGALEGVALSAESLAGPGNSQYAPARIRVENKPGEDGVPSYWFAVQVPNAPKGNRPWGAGFMVGVKMPKGMETPNPLSLAQAALNVLVGINKVSGMAAKQGE